jgi:tetratricopeptide (TPR) repeat protein
VRLAKTYMAMGNTERAIHFYEQAVKGNSGLITAQFELGKLYLRTNKNLEALELFKGLVGLQPQNPEFQYFMGQSLQGLGRFPEAIATFKKGVALDGTHLRSLHQLGKHYVTKRALDSVLFYVDKGLQVYENDVYLINLKAQALYNDRRIHQALPLFEKLVELGEEKPFIYQRLGILYTAMADHEKARDTYTKMLELEPMDVEALYGLGNAHYGLQALDSAETYIRLSIAVQQVALDKEYATLARIAIDRGDFGEAIANYREAYKENPEGYLYKYEICFLTDQYYKDPKMKLECYRSYDRTFGHKKDYFSEFSRRRIQELTEEIHFAERP